MEKQIIIEQKDKPHSLEIGKAGQRAKIYYNEVPELISHLSELVMLGAIDEESIPPKLADKLTKL